LIGISKAELGEALILEDGETDNDTEGLSLALVEDEGDCERLIELDGE